MKILFIFGTRPEAIKLSPLIKEFQSHSKQFEVKTCISAQHREMLDPILKFFAIKPDFDLNIMKSNQDLFDISARLLNTLKNILSQCKPDWVIVQGDTTTTFIGALAAFYAQVKVAHIEAGLRSYNKLSPYPEEMNRILTTFLADIYFAHTINARNNLLKLSIPENKIFVVGNTVIDALLMCMEQIRKSKSFELKYLKIIDFRKRIVLVTSHRRESFGQPFRNICQALNSIARRNNVEIVYPVHLNPNVREPVFKILGNRRNIHLLDPVPYPDMVWLMTKSYIILTDSGGIQEEAPSLGKPVLIMREVTERTEGVEAGTALLVGSATDRIVDAAERLLSDTAEYNRMAKAQNPYGDGKTSKRIVNIFKQII